MCSREAGHDNGVPASRKPISCAGPLAAPNKTGPGRMRLKIEHNRGYVAECCESARSRSEKCCPRVTSPRISMHEFRCLLKIKTMTLALLLREIIGAHLCRARHSSKANHPSLFPSGLRFCIRERTRSVRTMSFSSE